LKDALLLQIGILNFSFENHERRNLKCFRFSIILTLLHENFANIYQKIIV